MRKIKTWKDNLNDVIRDVIFVDEELLDYMMIPKEDRSNIIKFIDKYFVRSPAPDELITTEQVRICWSEQTGRSLGSNMLKKYINLDIYVNTKHLHDVGDDMLVSRTDLICEKIKEDLTDDKYVCMIDFRYEDDYDLYTKLIGYARHRLVLSYKISF